MNKVVDINVKKKNEVRNGLCDVGKLYFDGFALTMETLKAIAKVSNCPKVKHEIMVLNEKLKGIS